MPPIPNRIIGGSITGAGGQTSYIVEAVAKTKYLRKIANLEYGPYRFAFSKDYLFVYQTMEGDMFIDEPEDFENQVYYFYAVPLEASQLPNGVQVTEGFTIFNLRGQANSIPWTSEVSSIRVEIDPDSKEVYVDVNGVRLTGVVRDDTSVTRILDSVTRTGNRVKYMYRINTGFLQYLHRLSHLATLYSNGVIVITDNPRSPTILGPDTIYNDKPVFENLARGWRIPETVFTLFPMQVFNYIAFDLLGYADVYIGRYHDNGETGEYVELADKENRISLFFPNTAPLDLEETLSEYPEGYKMLAYTRSVDRIKSIYSHVYPLPPPGLPIVELDLDNLDNFQELLNQLDPEVQSNRIPIYWQIVGDTGIAFSRDNFRMRRTFSLSNEEELSYSKFLYFNPVSLSLVKAYALFNILNHSDRSTQPGCRVIKVKDLPEMIKPFINAHQWDDASYKFIQPPLISYPYYDGPGFAYIDRDANIDLLPVLDKIKQGILVTVEEGRVYRKPKSPIIGLQVGFTDKGIRVTLTEGEVRGRDGVLRIVAEGLIKYSDFPSSPRFTSDAEKALQSKDPYELISNLNGNNYPYMEGLLTQPLSFYVSRRAMLTDNMSVALGIVSDKPFILVNPPFKEVNIIIELEKLKIE